MERNEPPQPERFTSLNRYDTLDAWLDSFILARQSARCTPATIRFYRSMLEPFVRWLQAYHALQEPRQIDANHIRQFLVELQERELADTTQHAYARSIKAWLSWLVNEDELEKNPMRRVQMPRVDQKIPPPFSVKDIGKLLDACDRSTLLGVRNYAIVLCLLDSGLRRSEFTYLRLCDVNMKTGIVFVRRGKGGKQRQTRFGARARSALLRYLAKVPELEPTAPLWGLSPRGVQIMLSRLGKRAGVTPCCPHRFRRTFALWMLRDGVDLHSLRVLMGHSDLSVLQRYLALDGTDVERVHIAHSPADNWL